MSSAVTYRVYPERLEARMDQPLMTGKYPPFRLDMGEREPGDLAAGGA